MNGPPSAEILAEAVTPVESRAAVFHGVGRPLTVERFPIPRLKAGEALVRIRHATICGSDLHSFHGRREAPVPSVPGHEMVGEMAGLGPGGVPDYRGACLNLGDRVTWSMVWSCGECFFCRRGLGSKCERLMKFGHEAITPERALNGGLAEYCHLPAKTAIFKIPGNLPDLAACPANCATATVMAVFRHAGAVEGETVVIQGAGMLGLTACAVAASGGAARVIALEPDRARRGMALKFGATEALDGSGPAEGVCGRILELTGGRGADIAVELSGQPEAVELGLKLLRMGARYVLAGSTFPARPVRLQADQVVKRMLQLTGVHNYQPADLESALEFLSRNMGNFPFEELVGGVFPLAEINAAIAQAGAGVAPRIAVTPW